MVTWNLHVRFSTILVNAFVHARFIVLKVTLLIESKFQLSLSHTLQCAEKETAYYKNRAEIKNNRLCMI